MYNGILAVWKPKGLTSHDVVFKLRKLFKQKRIGHTGTLDPQVDGVLLICLGQATKLVELLMDGKKIYKGEILLGYSTETEDHYGDVVEQKDVMQAVDELEIDALMASFDGWITQIPPYYSAVKVNGRRLYEYARAGQEVDRPKRQVYIDYFKRTSEIKYDGELKQQRLDFEVSCGKGTYVRTLAVDLGKLLGYPSHMSSLRRTATGGFAAGDAFTLTEIEKAIQLEKINEILHPIEDVLQEYDTLELSVEDFELVRNGQVLSNDYFEKENPIEDLIVLKFKDKVVAIYQPHPTKADLIKPFKMFPQNL